MKKSIQPKQIPLWIELKFDSFTSYEEFGELITSQISYINNILLSYPEHILFYPKYNGILPEEGTWLEDLDPAYISYIKKISDSELIIL